MFKEIKKNYILVVVALTMVLFSGCGIDNTGKNTVGSNFVSAELIDDVDGNTSLNYVQAFGIDAEAASAFAYKVIKITYNTKDEHNNSVVASGVLVVPTITQAFLDGYKALTGKDYSISLIADNHGTIFTDAEAPSNSITTPASDSHIMSILMTGKAGFAVAMPDYLGYGVSNDASHPYMLKKSSAQVSIDMLRASVRYMTDNNILYNGQVYISGYSQGGYTAMAMAQEIEANHSDEFTLKGVAPMAGPHNLAALGDIEIDADHTMVYPAFLGYLASSYSTAYDDIELSSIVNMTDTDMFNSLFDGSNTNVAIHMGLGLVTDERGGFNQHKANILFQDDAISDYQNNLNGALRAKFEENSVYDWTPSTRMNLIHCTDDEIIPFSMSQDAYDKFIENGVSEDNVTLTALPTVILSQQQDAVNPFIHANCASTAYGAAVQWFDNIRQGN